MILQVFFGEVQTGLGFQFYDSTGALLGARVTAGIVSLPEAGAYSVEAEPPSDAVGVFWDSDAGEASEDLRGAAEMAAAAQILLVENYEPTGSPAVILPDPPEDAALCRVFLNVADLGGGLAGGVKVEFSLSEGAAVAERVIKSRAVSMVTDEAGFAEIDLIRTDDMEPEGKFYLVTCAAVGLEAVEMPLESATFDLAGLI